VILKASVVLINPHKEVRFYHLTHKEQASTASPKY
jgi:hypothetical protein